MAAQDPGPPAGSDGTKFAASLLRYSSTVGIATVEGAQEVPGSAGEYDAKALGVTLACRATGLAVVERLGTPDERELLDVPWTQFGHLLWDHQHTSVKVTLRNKGFLTVKADTLALQSELDKRFAHSGTRPVPSQFLGVFIGLERAKPFQRKRANLSTRTPGKLPSLAMMQAYGEAKQGGPDRTVPLEESRRVPYALDYVHDGANTFAVTRTTLLDDGASEVDPATARLVLDAKGIVFAHDVNQHEGRVLFPYSAIEDWLVTPTVDVEHAQNANWLAMSTELGHDDVAAHGLSIRSDGREILFAVPEVHHLRDCLEHNWNKSHAEARPGSVHGRTVQSLHTLTGLVKHPHPPIGSIEMPNPSSKHASAKERASVRTHWNKVDATGTFCAVDHETRQQWLQMLASACDEDVAIMPDNFVEWLVTFNGALDGPKVLRIGAWGIVVLEVPENDEGPEPEPILYFDLTQILKWSVTKGPSGPGFRFVHAKSKVNFSMIADEAAKIASTVEHFIERFLDRMHLWNEVLDQPVRPTNPAPAAAAAAAEPANSATAAPEANSNAAPAPASPDDQGSATASAEQAPAADTTSTKA